MAEKRYAHFLKPCKGGRWPTSVIVVDCISRYETDKYNERSHTESLQSWHAAVLTLRDGTYGVTRYVTSRYSCEWWENVASALADGTSCTIIAANAQRTWSLLGVWDKFESGELALSPHKLSSGERNREAIRRVRLSQSNPLAPISPTQYSREAGRDTGFIVLSDPPNIVQCYHKSSKARITLVDVQNYGVEIDSTWVNGPTTVSRLSAWINDYCQACSAAKLGSFQTTAASQAMHGFRAGHLRSLIYVNGSRNATEFEQRSYHGGRCEAYRIGVVPPPLWYLDIRASYPFVCATQQVPVRCRGHRTTPSGTHPGSAEEFRNRIALCRITTTEPSYPVERNGITIFPVGTFRTVLCGPELCDAIEHDRVDEIYEYTEYDMADSLSTFAKALYDMRESADTSGNKAISQCAKRIAVSLPGKLGQRTMQWRTRYDVQADGKFWQGIAADEYGRPSTHRWLGSVVQILEKGDYYHDACPAIASWITSVGRIALLKGIRAAGWKHVYYADTDAIMCDEHGRYNLTASGLYCERQWGMFGHRWGPQSVDIRGIKYYLHNGETVCAGIPRGHCVDIGDEDACILYDTATSQIRRGEQPHVEAHVHTYSRGIEYKHGIVQEDGSVMPHTMVE